MVAIAVVTYNSASFIRRCLEYVFEQDYSPYEVIVIDNASQDSTPAILREFESRIRAVYNRENVGFAAGQNQAIALTQAAWILTLNPDTRLARDFLSKTRIPKRCSIARECKHAQNCKNSFFDTFSSMHCTLKHDVDRLSPQQRAVFGTSERLSYENHK